MIGKSIQTRLFSAVFLVIFMMTFGVGITFFFSSRWYLQYTARKETEHLIRMVQSESDRLSTDSAYTSSDPEENMRESSKALLRSVRLQLRDQPYNGIFLIFNSKQKLVFPQSGNDQNIYPMSALEEQCRQMIQSGELVSGKTSRILLSEDFWYISMYVFPSSTPVRAKYFVSVVQIPDSSVFWNYTWKLYIAILIASVFLSSFLVWGIARTISDPIRHLCLQIQRINGETDAQIRDSYSLNELESLKRSYNQMEETIRRSEEEKRQFFQNASHDLKTPLASITGYSQGIVSNVIKDHQKAASIILSESLRMTDLVESILSLSKMDSHTLDLHPADLEVMEFLDECVDIMSTIRRDCVIHLEAGRPLTIHTDPELLKRVIQNILSNCLRYADHEILIRMSTDGNSLILLIQDDGPGFPEKDLPHIFERFYKGNGGKNGIGLSIVWAGIHYLGGSITAGNRAVPEHGAYYQLLLPLSLSSGYSQSDSVKTANLSFKHRL